MRVVLVPTMGTLHTGHTGLIRRARKLAGAKGLVVVSIYVNPAQFNDPCDFRAYPRTLIADKKLCRAEGVDVVFVPSDMYAVDASVFVEETAVAGGMEGDSRPGHFRGVATIVVKLFNLVLPEVAVFGEKDWQQMALMKRVVRGVCIRSHGVVRVHGHRCMWCDPMHRIRSDHSPPPLGGVCDLDHAVWYVCVNCMLFRYHYFEGNSQSIYCFY